jgi:ribosomal protein S18 acetylase RimI-like enzyme
MGEFALGTDDIGGETQMGEEPGEDGARWQMRGVNASDLDALTVLVARALDSPWRRGALEAAFEARGARGLVAAFRPDGPDSSVVGFVLGRRIAELLEIDLVGVDPPHRRAGVARRLLVQLIDSEQRAGAREVRLELAASNAPARALYEALGFVVVGRRARYYPDGDDALLLTRRLG